MQNNTGEIVSLILHCVSCHFVAIICDSALKISLQTHADVWVRRVSSFFWANLGCLQRPGKKQCSLWSAPEQDLVCFARLPGHRTRASQPQKTIGLLTLTSLWVTQLWLRISEVSGVLPEGIPWPETTASSGGAGQRWKELILQEWPSANKGRELVATYPSLFVTETVLRNVLNSFLENLSETEPRSHRGHLLVHIPVLASFRLCFTSLVPHCSFWKHFPSKPLALRFLSLSANPN